MMGLPFEPITNGCSASGANGGFSDRDVASAAGAAVAAGTAVASSCCGSVVGSSATGSAVGASSTVSSLGTEVAAPWPA